MKRTRPLGSPDFFGAIDDWLKGRESSTGLEDRSTFAVFVESWDVFDSIFFITMEAT